MRVMSLCFVWQMLQKPLGIAAIEDAVKKVLAEGYRTVDIMDEGKTRVGTTKMGDLIAERIG